MAPQWSRYNYYSETVFRNNWGFMNQGQWQQWHTASTCNAAKLLSLTKTKGLSHTTHGNPNSPRQCSSGQKSLYSFSTCRLLLHSPCFLILCLFSIRHYFIFILFRFYLHIDLFSCYSAFMQEWPEWLTHSVRCKRASFKLCATIVKML